MPEANTPTKRTPAKRKSRAKPAAQRSRGGRPSPIDAIVGHHKDTGAPITVADRIVGSLRAGNYLEPSCAAAGIVTDTVYEWLKVAGRLRLRARGEPLDTLDPRPTAHERRCLAFSDAVDEAQGIWEVGANTTLEQLGRGGIEVVTVTEKHDAAGKLIDRTTKTEKLPPSAQVIEWRLTRRHPKRYSEKIDLDAHMSGTVTFTVEERAATLADALSAYLEGREDVIVEQAT